MTEPASPHPRSTRIVLGVVIGAVIGFVLGATAYFVLAPWLESQSGLLREMQGFAFNLVPLLTLAGGGLGAWWAVRRR